MASSRKVEQNNNKNAKSPLFSRPILKFWKWLVGLTACQVFSPSTALISINHKPNNAANEAMAATKGYAVREEIYKPSAA